MEAFRTRRLDHVAFSYLFCDATYVKGRLRDRVVNRAVVVVTAGGNREVLGVDVGDSEDGTFWTAFLRGLRERGLAGVRLVITDQHFGLKEAIEKVFIGASWQRCRVHFLRNALSRAPKAKTQMVAAAIRTIFAQPDASHVRQQLVVVADMLSFTLPDVAALLLAAKENLTAFSSFPMSVRLVPDHALDQDLVDESARARDHGDQTSHERRRHLPERRLGAPARHRGPCRAARRMGSRRAPLPLRGVDDAHRRSRSR